MVTNRQPVVKPVDGGVDGELASFIADVIELAGLFRHVADKIARQEGQTQTIWYALSVFSAEPLTVSQAARRLGTTRQAVQRTANELLDQGLATAESNPDHRASPLIILTLLGHETLARISTTASTARKQWFFDHDVAGLRAAHAEVLRLRTALGQAVDGPTQQRT